MKVNILSDGPIKNFTKGWALIPFKSGKAHYYRDTTGTAAIIGDGGRIRELTALCGHQGYVDDKRPPLGAGNFDRCQRCQKAL